MNMTIKQVLIGAVLGSSVLVLMVHRMRKEKAGSTAPQVVASLGKAHHPKKHTGAVNTELSSGRLFG